MTPAEATDDDVESAGADDTDADGAVTFPDPSVEAFSSFAVSHAETIIPAMTTTEKTLNNIWIDPPVSFSIQTQQALDVRANTKPRNHECKRGQVFYTGNCLSRLTIALQPRFSRHFSGDQAGSDASLGVLITRSL